MLLSQAKNIFLDRKKEFLFLVIWSIFIIGVVIIIAVYVFPDKETSNIDKEKEICGYLNLKPCSPDGCKIGLENINGICKLKEGEDNGGGDNLNNICGRFNKKPCVTSGCFEGLEEVNGICKIKEVKEKESDSAAAIAQTVRIIQLIITIVIGYGVSESARGKEGVIVRILPYIIFVYIGLTQFEIISTPNLITNWIVVVVSLLLLFFFIIVRKQITLGVKMIYLIGLFFTAIFSILAQYSNVFNSALETEPQLVPAIVVTSITSFILLIFVIGHIRKFGFDTFDSQDDYENGMIELRLLDLEDNLKNKSNEFDKIIKDARLDQNNKDDKLDVLETEISEIFREIKERQDRIRAIESGKKKRRILLNLSRNAIFTDVFSDVSSLYEKIKKKREKYNKEFEKNEKTEKSETY
jgi:hypothetical protein